MKPSIALEIVLWVKIIVTLFWSVPLIVIPASGFHKLGIPPPKPLLFVRLLGAAFFSLLIGYIFGVRDLHYNKNVTNIVWTGIVSNGLAFLIMLYFGYQGSWREWSNLGITIMWLSTVATGIITVGLIITGLMAE